MFDSPAHLRTEVTRFNTEYRQYSDLVPTKEEDIEKLHIIEQTILDYCTKNNLTKKQIISKEYYEKLTKKDFIATKIYVLRKVERIGEKKKEDEV